MPKTSLFRRILENFRQTKAARRQRSVRNLFETLERREMLAADVYVDNVASSVISGGFAGDFLVSNDQGALGTLDNGDEVVWRSGAPEQVAGLIWGTNAFDSIANGLVAVDVGGEVHVGPGTFVSTGQLNVTKSLSLIGAGQDATILERAGVASGTEDRAIEIQAANVAIKDLTLGGWADPPSNAEVGNGYLAWTIADFTTIDNVRFDGNDNRVAIYIGTQDDVTITDSRFTGTFFRAAIRGAGERMEISRNSFEESHYWYSPIYMEYGAPTSGTISYNYFAHRVGVNNQVFGNFKSDGTGLYAITNWQPNAVTPDGLYIKYNTFDFQDSDLVNGGGAQPIPVGVFNDPVLTASGPIVVSDNIFQGYKYTGPQPSYAPPGAPTWQPTGGKFGGALELDGYDDYATFSSPLFDIGQTGSFSLYVNLDVLGKRHMLAGGAVEYQVRNTNDVYFYPGQLGNGNTLIRSSTLMNAGVWTHLVFTWDKTLQTGRIYKDGVEVNYLAGNDPNVAPFWTTALDTVNKLIYLGRDPGDATRYLDGKIDDVAWFNDVLTPAEIVNIRDQGVAVAAGADPNLLVHWDLDQAAGNIATDNKNGVPLTVTTTTPGPVFQPAGGQFGGALEFDGLDDYATFEFGSHELGDKGTLNLWVRPDTVTKRNMLFEGPGNGGLEFQIRNTSDVYFYVNQAEGNNGLTRSSTLMTAGVWQNLQFTWDYATKETHIYLNGTEVSYLTGFGPNRPSWSSIASTITGYMNMGRDPGDPARFLDGRIDDVAWFDDVLSVAERNSIRTGSANALAGDPRMVAYWNLDDAVGTTTVPGDGGTSISLYVQQTPPPSLNQGYAVKSGPGTTVTNNLFYDNDVNYNPAVTDIGDNLIGNPLFDEGAHFTAPITTDEYYALKYHSPAVNAGSGFPNPAARHIGAYQGVPLPAANTVFVNEDWVGTAFGVDPDGSGPALFFGVDSFATIQAGINLVADAGTVVVLANNDSGYAGFSLDRDLTLSFIEDYQFPTETTVTLNGAVSLLADSDWNLGDGVIGSTTINPADLVVTASATVDSNANGSHQLSLISVTDGAGSVTWQGAVGVAFYPLSVVLGQAGNRLETLSVSSALKAGSLAVATKQDIDLTATASLESMMGTVTLSAGDDLTIPAGAVITSAATASLSIDAGGDDPGVGATVTIDGLISSAGGISLIGGPDSDVILLHRLGSGGMTIDAGNGADDYTIPLGNVAGALINSLVSIVDSGAAGVDQVWISGGTLGDSFTISATGLDRGADAIDFNGAIEELYVDSLAGEDVINLSPSLTTSMFLDGGSPSPPVPVGTGDHLIFDALAGAVSDTGSVLTRVGYQPVSYVEFERLTVDNAALVVDGDDGLDDILTVSATSNNDGTYVLTTDGVVGPTVIFTNIAALTFNGFAGNDKLIVNNPAVGVFAPSLGVVFNGGADSDSLEIVGGTANSGNYTPGFAADEGTLTQTEGAFTQNVTFTGIENGITHTTAVTTFTIAATSGNDTINVVNGPLYGADQTIELNFNGAFEEIRFAKKSAVTVLAGNGADTFNINYTTAQTGDGTIYLDGEGGTGTFNILASSPVSMNTNLIGGTSADSFVFSDGVVLSGNANGNSGVDTLDLALNTTARSVNVNSAGIGTGFNGTGNSMTTFSNIETLVGGAASDTLQQNMAIDTSWNMSSANAGTLQASSRSLAFSSIENVVGANSGDDTFLWSPGASLSGSLNARNGNDSLDYSIYGSSVTVDLTAGTATNLGSIVVDGLGSSIENLYGSNQADTLVGDISGNLIRGNDGADVINAKGGADDVDGNGGDDDIQVEGTEAEFDTIQGSAGYDQIFNVGAGAVTLNGFNAAFDVWTNSIEEYLGAGQALLGNSGVNGLHLGFTALTNTPSVNSGANNDSVTTSYNNSVLTAYDGDAGTDQVTLVFTPTQFDALTTADILAVQSYVAAPTGQTLTVTNTPAKGNFTATNFESAKVAVHDDGLILDITTCFSQILTDAQIVVGGDGTDDTLTGTTAVDLIFGQGGNDTINGLNLGDCLFGGAGNDLINGNSGSDLISGGSGNDTLNGNEDNDTIFGGLGDDLLTGDFGFDVLQGNAGNDTLDGGMHDDVMNGGAGDDTLLGGDGYDQFQVVGTEAEFDTMNGGNNTDTVMNIGGTAITFNSFVSTTNSVEAINGAGFAILGNDSANTLHFQLVSMSGVPFVDGGAGNDTITGTNGIDDLRGGAGNDTIFGLGGTDTIRGGADNDSLNGGDAIDQLYGDDGVDTITSGAGRDVIYFVGDVASEDVITDFAIYSDFINLAAYGVTYAQVSFAIASPNTTINVAPTNKKIKLLNWTRVVGSGQFQFV